MTAKSLGERLKNLREGQGLTQQRLADKLGVSQSTIKMIEKNERKPSLKLLEDISLYFGTTKNFILEGEESSQPTYPKGYKALSSTVTEKSSSIGDSFSESTSLISTSDLLKSLVLTRKITSSNNLSSEVKDLISKILRLEIDTLLEIHKGRRNK